ncbi:MAG: hypothetical protein GY819_10000, partial [Planctomycetaceae bacterium]|nr:hypothetical protein [Planctomycetaceae bacterium]
VGFGILIVAINNVSETGLFVGLTVISSGFAFIQPSLHALVSVWSPADQQGSVLGFAQSLNAMARILGSAVGIPLLKYNTTLPYSSAAALMIITAIFIGIASRFQGRGE